jgi:hypothetical protein
VNLREGSVTRNTGVCICCFEYSCGFVVDLQRSFSKQRARSPLYPAPYTSGMSSYHLLLHTNARLEGVGTDDDATILDHDIGGLYIGFCAFAVFCIILTSIKMVLLKRQKMPWTFGIGVLAVHAFFASRCLAASASDYSALAIMRQASADDSQWQPFKGAAYIIIVLQGTAFLSAQIFMLYWMFGNVWAPMCCRPRAVSLPNTIWCIVWMLYATVLASAEVTLFSELQAMQMDPNSSFCQWEPSLFCCGSSLSCPSWYNTLGTIYNSCRYFYQDPVSTVIALAALPMVASTIVWFGINAWYANKTVPSTSFLTHVRASTWKTLAIKYCAYLTVVLLPLRMAFIVWIERNGLEPTSCTTLDLPTFNQYVDIIMVQDWLELAPMIITILVSTTAYLSGECENIPVLATAAWAAINTPKYPYSHGMEEDYADPIYTDAYEKHALYYSLVN